MTVPMDQPPRMSDEQAGRVDAMIARQDSTLAFVRNVGVLLVVLFVIVGLTAAAVLGRLGHVESIARTQERNQREIKATQADGIVRGYESRSVNCTALLLSATTRLPGNCTDPAVLPYVCRTALQSNPSWVPRVEEQVGRSCPFPRP